MLQLEHVSKTFHPGTVNEVRSLNDVSLDLAQGSFLIIIGTNGSGKSTLLNAVAGSFIVDTGKITLAGHQITRWPEPRATVRQNSPAPVWIPRPCGLPYCQGSCS